MPAPVTLDAGQYRSEITAIDRLVFEEGSFTNVRREALSERFRRLARRVKASSGSRFVQIEALEIRRLAEVARRIGGDAPDARLANEWMRIRNNLFEDQAWFARSAADLEPGPGEVRQPVR